MNLARSTFLLLFLLLILLPAGCRDDILPASPEITISPAAGGPFQDVTIVGRHFPAQIEVTVRLGPPDVGASPTAYALATTDRHGNLRTAFVMPDRWPDGSLITQEQILVIVLNEDASVKASTPFTYQPPLARTPLLNLNPGNGQPGQPIEVAGENFPPQVTVGIQLATAPPLTYTALLTSTVTDEAGTLSALSITLPTTWPTVGRPIRQQDLFIEAVTGAGSQPLARTPFFNLAGEPPQEFYRPLNPGRCETIAQTIASALGAPLTHRQTAVAYEDRLTGLPGSACQLVASGPGSQFTAGAGVAQDLETVFIEGGWIVDPRYRAGRPGSTIFAFRKEEALAVIQVKREPAPGQRCPFRQSLEWCLDSLPGEKILYDITIELLEARN